MFDLTFKKCQSIYVNAKNSDDDQKPLSHANLETHNQQQQQIEAEKPVDEKLFSESIKGN